MLDFGNSTEGFVIFSRMVGVVGLILSGTIFWDRRFINQNGRYRNGLLALSALGLIFQVYPALCAMIYWYFYGRIATDCPHAFDIGEKMLNFFLFMIVCAAFDESVIRYGPYLAAGYLSLLYWSTAWGKVVDPNWRSGKALAAVMDNTVLRRFRFPSWFPLKLAAALIIIPQLLFPMLIWWPALTPWVIAMMVLKHATMELFLNILVFSQVVLCGLFLCLYL